MSDGERRSGGRRAGLLSAIGVRESIRRGYDSVRMGIFDFFKRRRDRESAIPGGTSESLTRQLKGGGE